MMLAGNGNLGTGEGDVLGVGIAAAQQPDRDRERPGSRAYLVCRSSRMTLEGIGGLADGVSVEALPTGSGGVAVMGGTGAARSHSR